MIELHPEKKMPLYEQLYNALAQDIRSGALQPGKALPGRLDILAGSRALCGSIIFISTLSVRLLIL